MSVRTPMKRGGSQINRTTAAFRSSDTRRYERRLSRNRLSRKCSITLDITMAVASETITASNVVWMIETAN